MFTLPEWKGYNPRFLNGFAVPLPDFTAWKHDVATNRDNGKHELKFLHYSAVQCKSRRLPLFTASNIYRDKLLPLDRTGSFKQDERLLPDEQLSNSIYTKLNKLQTEPERKLAKGHMVRREDVQWDAKGDATAALQASASTFFYSNACPQHQAVNNDIWKQLENSILVKGRSRKPAKAIVFTGPVLDPNDPFLAIATPSIQCPLRFWKAVYFVNEDQQLRCTAFIMSHKKEVESDGYVQRQHALIERLTGKVQRPFLEFDERKKYQVSMSILQRLTGLQFPPANEPIIPRQFAALRLRPQRTIALTEHMGILTAAPLIDGLVL